MLKKKKFDTFDFLVCLNISFLKYADRKFFCGQTTQDT